MALASNEGAATPTKLNRQRFANCLKMVWSNARYEALPVAVKVERLEARKQALLYKPFGHSIRSECADIDRQINQLIAA